MKLLIVLLLTLGASSTFAAGPTFNSSTSYKGFVSVGFLGGYSESRLLNSDGTYNSFAGEIFGGSIDIQLFNFGSSELRGFGTYTISNATSKESDDRLKRNGAIFGLKMFANPNLFLSAGMGSSKQKLTRDNDTFTFDHKVTAIGLGYDFQLTEKWYLGLHAAYKSGPIPSAQNTALSQNSYWETGELGLVLTWSPPSTTINYSGK